LVGRPILARQELFFQHDGPVQVSDAEDEVEGEITRQFELFEVEGDETGLRYIRSALGDLRSMQGRLEEALEVFEMNLDGGGNSFNDPSALINIGYTLARMEDRDRAEDYLRKALSVRDGVGPLVITVPYALFVFAIISPTPERAARPLGTCEGIRRRMGSVLQPAEEIDLHELEVRLHSSINGAEFEKCFQEGMSMSTDEAIAFALHN